MEGKGMTSIMQTRHRDAYKTPNPSKSVPKAATVSAAGVFKARKFDTPQQPSTRSGRRPVTKKSKREGEGEEAHPLALAFREKSENYRRQLYHTAVARIDKDLDSLLNKLYESNLQVASSDPVGEGSQVSPLRLTIPARYQRLVQNIYRPLTSYSYSLQILNPSGEVECIQTSLRDRFQEFEEHIRIEAEQMKGLQRQWESVVAAIFQLGVACLGETDVATLLSTVITDADVSLPVSKDESTLSVPKYGNPVREKTKRKHVSFAGPDMMATFPGFLLNVSGPEDPIPTAPDLPQEGIGELKEEVSILGKQHSKDLWGLERDHKAWWERKQKQFAHTLMQD